jgi:predicted ATP-grasp superfamily ATP-dependent carboligase
VKADLGALKEFVSDIPWPGTFFEKDQAIVSIYGRGPDRRTALALLDKHITTVRQYMG